MGKQGPVYQTALGCWPAWLMPSEISLFQEGLRLCQEICLLRSLVNGLNEGCICHVKWILAFLLTELLAKQTSCLSVEGIGVVLIQFRCSGLVRT